MDDPQCSSPAAAWVAQPVAVAFSHACMIVHGSHNSTVVPLHHHFPSALWLHGPLTWRHCPYTFPPSPTLYRSDPSTAQPGCSSNPSDAWCAPGTPSVLHSDAQCRPRALSDREEERRDRINRCLGGALSSAADPPAPTSGVSASRRSTVAGPARGSTSTRGGTGNAALWSPRPNPPPPGRLRADC